MDNEYEVKVTRQALEHMREIVHYISYDLMNPKAADNLLDDLKLSILKLSVLPKKHQLIDEKPLRPWGFSGFLFGTVSEPQKSPKSPKSSCYMTVLVLLSSQRVRII